MSIILPSLSRKRLSVGLTGGISMMKKSVMDQQSTITTNGCHRNAVAGERHMTSREDINGSHSD
jgi:hypothetical protein